jgi:hypothetical protein
MKTKVTIVTDVGGYYAIIDFQQPFLGVYDDTLLTINHASKGLLKRKVIQFCAALNLEVEFI